MKFLKTSDFSLAVTLITLGYDVKEIEDSHAKRVTFCFCADKQTQKAINDYWKDRILVSPRHFYMNQKLLKSRLYSEK